MYLKTNSQKVVRLFYYIIVLTFCTQFLEFKTIEELWFSLDLTYNLFSIV